MPNLSLLLKYVGKLLTTRFGYDVQRRNSLLRPAGDMQFLLAQLKQLGFRPQWMLDVGANKAEWSRTAKLIFPEAHCFLIEPQIEMQPQIEKFCQAFPGSQWVLAGAGSEPGELSLTVWDDLAGSSFLPSDQTAVTTQRRTVQIVTIDQLIQDQKLPIPELVKLDIQGFELEALKGATQLFGHTEVLILEVALFPFLPGQPLFEEVIRFMSDRDYVVYDFPGFLRRPYDRALGQCDVCFVRRQGALRASHAWG